MELPVAILHADWSVAANKRRVARATLRSPASYLVDEPFPAGDTGSLPQRIGLTYQPGGAVLAGFDFPIGIPRAYAKKVGIKSFRSMLAELGRGCWLNFFEVAADRNEISWYRPFYPRSCRTKRSHTREDLASKLGLSLQELYRACERRTRTRRAACPLFWTLGGNQVGKAALSGWRELLQPALGDSNLPLALWPFDGELEDLVAQRKFIVAETYPAEFYAHLGLGFDSRKGGGKRSQAARQRNARPLLRWAEAHALLLTDHLRTAVEQGFGPMANGEDDFDAVVGLLGLLNIILGGRSSATPPDAAVRTVEGWILGQAARAVC